MRRQLCRLPECGRWFMPRADRKAQWFCSRQCRDRLWHRRKRWGVPTQQAWYEARGRG
jgi:hypothetical protein